MLIRDAIREYSNTSRKETLVQLVPQLRENGGEDLCVSLLVMKMFEHDYPELLSELGDCYYQGEGVKKDIQHALKMFNTAATRGSVRSQYDLAWYYYDCHEYMRAIEYFSYCISNQNELSERKIKNSYSCLGDCYRKLSDPKISLAIENFAIAADKYHDGFSCRCLGILYSEPDSRHFDANKAVKYHELGVSYGDGYSAHKLGISYILGDEILKINKNGHKAESILLSFVDSGNCDILRDLGLLYRCGDSENGVAVDFEKSIKYYKKSYELYNDPFVAADLGYVYYRIGEYFDSEKMLLIADQAGCCKYSDFLGRLYKDGDLAKSDIDKAVFYYGRAYDNGTLSNVFTYAEYADLLEETGNYYKAFDIANKGLEEFNDIYFLFIKASLVLSGKVRNVISLSEAAEMMEVCIKYETNTKEACMTLGDYYLSVREYRKAERHYLDAFSLGVANAGTCLARLYEKGGGTINADANKAYEWFLKAGNAGDPTGREEAQCFKKGMFGGYRRVRSI